MSAVDLVALWFNQAAEPSVSRAFDDVAPYQWGQESTVRQQRTAAGTIRMIRSTTAGPKGTQLQMRGISRADTDWLVEYAETLFCCRDHTGRKVYGWWEPPNIGELEWVGDFATVSLTFHEATFDESV